MAEYVYTEVNDLRHYLCYSLPGNQLICNSIQFHGHLRKSQYIDGNGFCANFPNAGTVYTSMSPYLPPYLLHAQFIVHAHNIFLCF